MYQYPTVKKERDNILSDWGPYSKKLAGISHIEDKDAGMMMEFCVFPTQYRGMTQLPVEIYQSNYTPWFASEDMKAYGYRFELEWKDKVYADVFYTRQEDETVLVTSKLVNATDMPQAVTLQYLISRSCQESVEIKAAEDACIVDALSYSDIHKEGKNLFDGLCYDGALTGETIGKEYYRGHALGGIGVGAPRENSLQNGGDYVRYELPRRPQPGESLYIRANGKAVFQTDGICHETLEIGDGELKFYKIPVADTEEQYLLLTCMEGEGTVIDCVILSKSEPSSVQRKYQISPEVEEGEHQVILSYEDMENCCGAAWEGEQYEVRSFLTSRPETYLPHLTHDHVSKVLKDDGKDCYTNIFVRPIFLKPQQSIILKAVFASGTRKNVEEKLNYFRREQKKYPAEMIPDNCPDDAYAFSQRLMQAALLTNLVFPIRLQGNYIRHFTPGKWWDSLYTWDNGFIAWALAGINPALAEDCLNTYLTEPGNVHAAFVFHGSMVPVQVYVYKTIFDKTGDKKFLARYYDSMRQYYDFYVGHNPKSNTKMKLSGVLRTFDYFYNSGGWDDYPPQKYVTVNGLGKKISPVSNTCHAVNFARIMKMAAEELGKESAVYDSDIEELTAAVQRTYDSESGYYSYLEYEEDEFRILRHENGENYNKGLDGAYPLMADIGTEEQKEKLIFYMMSPKHMWTKIGISVVDQSATYYKNDGYWNGSVWMPHQWFAFLAMLEQGEAEYAAMIAQTALKLWKREVDYSYHCYEHFMVDSERGAGWHNFGGLSSPVNMWYRGLCITGTVTVPVNLMLTEKEESAEKISIRLRSARGSEGTSFIMAVPEKPPVKITVNGRSVEWMTCEKAVMIPCERNKDCTVEITK